MKYGINHLLKTIKTTKSPALLRTVKSM